MIRRFVVRSARFVDGDGECAWSIALYNQAWTGGSKEPGSCAFLAEGDWLEGIMREVAFLQLGDSSNSQRGSIGDGDTRGAVGDELPLIYDPDLIKNYWMKRPVSIVTRVL